MTKNTSTKKAVTKKAVRLSFAELVAIIATVMALNALAIDMMLPALGIIGDELNAPRDNDRQKIVVYYIMANGFGQLVFGPIVDRFGRRPVLIFSLLAYVAGSFLSIFATTFSLLIAARIFQGATTAAARVAALAIVRDQVSGRKMAEVMSLAITMFMAAPILAPLLGQMVMAVASWRAIFAVLLLYGLLIAIYAMFRVPETQAVVERKPLNVPRVISAYWGFVKTRQAIGYTLAGTCCFGGLFGYISTSEQIFLEIFKIGDFFGLAFACTAGALGAATLFNAKFVSRYGMRRITHTAVVAYIITNLLHLMVLLLAQESFISYLVFTATSFFCLGFIGPNTSALAMEPMGKNAGAGAAANGFFATAGAGFLGGTIGAFYDGTTMPVTIGFTILGVLSLLIILWTEKGRLFHSPQDDPQ